MAQISSNSMPKVLVLILSYNGRELLEDSVSTYLANDYPNFEVVVIDNGSVDGTKEYVEENFPEAKLIRLEKNRGYSGGFNFGLEYAFGREKADYVLITNNDVKVDNKIVSALVATASKDPKIGFVTGKAYYHEKPDTLQSVGKHEDPIRWNGEHIGLREVDRGQYDEEAERFFIDDIFMLVSRQVYEEVGGYDTTFFFQSEEYDWEARGKAAGYKIMYTPHAKLWHKESMTIGKQSAFKAYYDARNPLLVVLKHKEPAFFRKYFWYEFGKTIKGFLVSIKQRQFDVAVKKISGLFAALRWGIQQRKFSRKHFIA